MAQKRSSISPIGIALRASSSYSYTVGNVWFPVTGGLFLGDNANEAAERSSPAISRIRRTSATPCAAAFATRSSPRFWIATGIQYEPVFRLNSTATHPRSSPSTVSRFSIGINFARGRIYPSFQVSASGGVVLHKSDRQSTRFQVDGQNLNNVLDVLDFGGLFSGNAIGPPRSVAARLTTTF